MIARHFFEIDKGMERVFAHSPHMPASAIPKITQTLPRSSRRPPIPRALPNPTRKVAKAIPHPPITSRQTAASFSFGPMRNARPSRPGTRQSSSQSQGSAHRGCREPRKDCRHQSCVMEMDRRQEHDGLTETKKLHSCARGREPQCADKRISFAKSETEFRERLQARSDEPLQAVESHRRSHNEPRAYQRTRCPPVF